MGQAPAGSDFSLGLAKKRGHLDWPGWSPWLGLRCVCGLGWVYVSKNKDESHPLSLGLCNWYKSLLPKLEEVPSEGPGT